MNRLQPLRELRGASVAISLPMLLMIGVFVGLGAADGGYFQTAWLPAAMFALALLATALVTLSTRAAVPRAVLVAAGLSFAGPSPPSGSLLAAPLDLGDAGVAVACSTVRVIVPAVTDQRVRTGLPWSVSSPRWP